MFQGWFKVLAAETATHCKLLVLIISVSQNKREIKRV